MKKLVWYIIGVLTLTFATQLFAQGSSLEWLTISKEYCYSKGYGGFKDGVCFADYSNARKTCKNIGGRLPTIDELESEVKNICKLKEGMSSKQRKKIIKTCTKNIPYFSSHNTYWSSTKKGDSDKIVYAMVLHRLKKVSLDKYPNEWIEYHAQAVSCIKDETSIGKVIPKTKVHPYDNCKGCHGEKGERKALGKSKVIKDMSKEEIIAALKGYSNRTYGSSLKGLMRAFAVELTEKDMEDIVDYLEIK